MSELKGKVLCVDDEPNISRALQWLLQNDFDVTTAVSGQEALKLVAENDFDVLISDQRMPVMTGVEFFREARKISPRSVRILLTGYSDMQAVLRSVNEGEIYRFINKPWNISELPKVVDQAVSIARNQPVALLEPELTEDTPIRRDGDESVLLIDDDAGTLEQVHEAIGNSVRVHHARDLAEAVKILNEQRVSVIVSELSVGSVDATRLISIMKQKHPEIISVMLSAQSDADLVTALINEAQIFRFVPKPIRTGYLKLVINSALVKHRTLVDTPELALRHAVDPMTEAKLMSLVRDVERAAARAAVKARAAAIRAAGGSEEGAGSSEAGADSSEASAAAEAPAGPATEPDPAASEEPPAAPAGAGLFGRVSKGFKKLIH